MSNSQINYIFECCKNGKIQQLLDALDRSDNSEFIDDRNNTLLCLALKSGQWQTYTALLDSQYSFSPIKPLIISACQYNKDDVKGIELALKSNPEVNVLNMQNRTALMTASLLGHVNKAQLLIEKNASINVQDNQGNTTLIEAVNSNNKKMVDLILKFEPDVNLTNHDNETALIIGLKQKTPVDDIIKALLVANSDPEKLDKHNKSAWLIAKQKHPKIARLIEKHLNTINQIELPFFSNNYTNLDTQKVSETMNKQLSNTPITANISESVSKPMPQPAAKPLLFNNQKNKKTHKQEWFHAARTGNLGGLNRMIIEGIDIDCTDDKGCTALIRASGHSRRAVVSFLLQQKADLELRSNNGSTALSSSIIGNCRRVAGLLLDNGANPNGYGPSNYNYATIAAAQWNDAMLSILYRNGSDIFILNSQQQNLLHIIALAAEFYNNINNAKTSIQFLRDHGMDINTVDINGNTPLMILCGAHKNKYKVDDRNIASIVHFLIKIGAATAVTNQAKKSAIDSTRLHKLHQTKGVLMNALAWNID